MKKIVRAIALILIDILAVNFALFLSLWLRFDGIIMPEFLHNAVMLAPWATGVYIATFFFFRLYNRLWQYASIGEMLSIVLATLVGTMASVSLAYFHMVSGSFPLPRSVFILWSFLIVAMVGISRISWRLFREYHFSGLRAPKRKAALIIGAGDAGAMVAREFRSRMGVEVDAEPVGFVDDDPHKQGRRLYGLPVLGTREDIPKLVEGFNISEIVIAMPSVRGKVVREIMEICHKTGARLKILPGIYDLLDGKVNVDPIREVQIEDILGREPVQTDLEAIAGYLAGEVVLVTGAGGSIGSELCRQVASFRPRLLILMGRGENSIYDIHEELRCSFPDLELVQSIVDVKDKIAVEQVFYTYRPVVVFHTAAHKHLPLMEVNPAEAIKNNILGTQVVARAAEKHGCKAFILISTDKAVNPSSIMGASKRVAEIVVQDMARHSRTRFAAVRFGNVLGSRGSIIPLFKRQIAAGGPVTVTHPDMTRYFMTIPEAVQLVIQAGSFAKGGEIFVLNMGEPVKIVDLARSMIILSGFEPGEDIQIEYVGIRPGEKLFEELMTAGEGFNSTSHERIFIAKPEEIDEIRLENLLLLLSEPERWADMAGVEELLRLVLREFRVAEKRRRLVRVV